MRYFQRQSNELRFVPGGLFFNRRRLPANRQERFWSESLWISIAILQRS